MSFFDYDLDEGDLYGDLLWEAPDDDYFVSLEHVKTLRTESVYMNYRRMWIGPAELRDYSVDFRQGCFLRLNAREFSGCNITSTWRRTVQAEEDPPSVLFQKVCLVGNDMLRV